MDDATRCSGRPFGDAGNPMRSRIRNLGRRCGGRVSIRRLPAKNILKLLVRARDCMRQLSRLRLFASATSLTLALCLPASACSAPDQSGGPPPTSEESEVRANLGQQPLAKSVAAERAATRAETLQYLVEVHHTRFGRERFLRDGTYQQATYVLRVGSYTLQNNRFCVSITPPVEPDQASCRRLIIRDGDYILINDGEVK